MEKQYELVDIKKLETTYESRLRISEKIDIILVDTIKVLYNMLDEPKIDLDDIYYVCDYKTLVDRLYDGGKNLCVSYTSKLLFMQFYGAYELVSRKETY